ncbi:hypothetical protein D3C73_308740 [compost metagenome]
MLQYVNISDSKVTFANPESDPQKQTADLTDILGNMLMESAQDKATIADLTDTVGNLLLEVAALKGGAA